MASRYENSPIVSSPFRGGILRGRELRKAPAWSFLFSLYQVSEGDRIDTLAARFCSGDDRWWMIADANPEIVDWLRMTPGIVIRIPNVLG